MVSIEGGCTKEGEGSIKLSIHAKADQKGSPNFIKDLFSFKAQGNFSVAIRGEKRPSFSHKVAEISFGNLVDQDYGFYGMRIVSNDESNIMIYIPRIDIGPPRSISFSLQSPPVVIADMGHIDMPSCSWQKWSIEAKEVK